MKKNHTKNPQVLSVEEVAYELGVSRSSAYALFHRKDFPCLRVGVKRLVCMRPDFERFVAEKMRTC